MRRGKFITFEGPEGSGKSTQIRRLAAFLSAHKIRCVVTREPGGTPAGEHIRKILLNKKGVRVEPLTELFLYMAARAQIVRDVIKPALGRGMWVLCDRFLDASLCYQGFGHGMELGFIRRLGREAVGPLKPDRTFLLDLDVRIGLARARGRGAQIDRIEAKSIVFHKKVRRGYQTLARREPKRFCVIQATGSKDVIAAKIRTEVGRFFATKVFTR